MKNFFKKIRPYNFWVGLSAALVVLVASFGRAFGFEVENKVVEDVVLSIAGVLSVFGIVTGKPSNEDGQIETKESGQNDTEIDADDTEKSANDTQLDKTKQEAKSQENDKTNQQKQN